MRFVNIQSTIGTYLTTLPLVDSNFLYFETSLKKCCPSLSSVSYRDRSVILNVIRELLYPHGDITDHTKAQYG